MKLSKIFDKAPNIEIGELTTDSRVKTKNGMFFCLDGLNTNGHRFIPQAIKNGATCIVHSEKLTHYEDGIAYIKVENVNKTLSKVVHIFYGAPSHKMKMFGVTGTNGKSTVTNIINDIYNHFDNCGYIGTIAIRYNDINLPPDLTTPNPIYLNDTLNKMVNANVKAVALEVSSHGLDLGRVDGIDFDFAIFTNLTYDHLDFHGTMQNYFNAKKKLFINMKEDGVCILNRDDPNFDELFEVCHSKTVTYGVENDADYRANNIKLYTNHSTFTLMHDGKSYEINTNLVAMYNIYNLLASIAALVESGFSMEQILPYLNQIKQIDGRMESIDEGQPFHVIVDFAHTPDGMEKVYQYAQDITPEGSDIITVFGSAGKRDKAKRKVFGEIADKYCDFIILTEDDPRDEDPRDIANTIKEGIKDTNTIFIENRYDAIRMAIESANVHDTIMILGKGDEEFLYRDDERAPWIGDNNAVKEIIHKYYLCDDED